MSPHTSLAIFTAAVAVVGVTLVVMPARVRLFFSKLPQWSFNQTLLDNPRSAGLLRGFGVILLCFVALICYALFAGAAVY